MNTLIKRDRAILEYLVYHYGKEQVMKEMNSIKKDIAQEKSKNNIQQFNGKE